MTKPLSERVFADKVLWDVIKTIGYGGFPFCELAARLKHLVAEHGAKKVSVALFEVAQHVGWVTTLNPAGRKAAWGVCGFPPESWDWVYRDGLGNPVPRPAGHQTPPEIPPRQIEPILDALCRLTATELDIKLRECRAALRRKVPSHERQLAEETIPRLESEMLRRGQDIPEVESQDPAVEKPKRTRRKKE